MIAAMCCFPYAYSLFSSPVKEEFSSAEREAGAVASGLKWELMPSSYSMESLRGFFVFFYGDHVHLASSSSFLNPAVHRLSAAGYQPSGKQNVCSHLVCGCVEPGGFARAADATEAADGQWSLASARSSTLRAPVVELEQEAGAL